MTPIVIDLSHHNVIPESLHETKASGIIGMIHKATEGVTYQDNKVDAREALCRDAGMLFGLYHFIRPGSITQQVDNFMDVYERYENRDVLIALDYEDTGVSLDDCVNWLLAVEGETKKKPVIYSGHVLKEKLGGKQHQTLNGGNYPLWLAQYGSNATLPPGWFRYWLWQYTDKGEVPGVTPPTDLNAGEIDVVRAYWVTTTVPEVNGMDIGEAVAQMRNGAKVTRMGWNGKDMWLMLQVPDSNSKMTLPYVYMKTAQGDLVPWLCSQTDLLATDWMIG
jgi:lysozyme